MFQAIQRAFSKYNKKQELVKIRLGICAMDKKARSKPMREILSRLPQELFEIVIFGDECILNKPIEEWPVVEVLIAFYSTRFPSHKALQYVALRKPFMVNDLEMDAVLKDRRKVYKILQQEGIDVPFHALCERDDPNKVNVIEEFDEYIVVNGVQINKPLVEKPVDAEDHNIYIYYPMSAGGGSKRLFRKVDDRSSEFYPHVNDLRKDGSFIYEEFVVTQGTDVKVYTVGPDYGHAEARKSPVVDGKVNRDSAGLEVRFPVILSPLEKDIARKVVTAFKQTVCGFDILRVQGRSYCCDVNGFSFVKNSRKYYDDASQVLVELMISTTRPDLHLQLSTRAPLVRPRVLGRGVRETLTSIPSVSSMLGISNLGAGTERRRSQEDASVAATVVNRRGSPSPGLEKQERSGKWSVPVPAENGQPTIIEESGRMSPSESTGSLDLDKEELRCVIGIIRHGDRTPKQKMKLMITEPRYIAYFHQYCQSPRRDLKVKSKAALLRFLEVTREVVADPVVRDENKVVWMKLKQIQDVLERWEISGINRKLQMKPEKWAVDSPGVDANEISDPEKVRVVEVLLILKWGGDLTPLGCQQAEDLGESFRYAMYPDLGGGMLRLHATYRHDLKIKASDEGRVMKTAAAFAKGLLELEGQLTPILASLVTVEEKDRQMLDREGNREIKQEMDRCKEHLHLLQSDTEITEELAQVIAPDCTSALKNSLLKLKNPVKALQRMHTLIGLLCDQLRVMGKEEEEELASVAIAALSTKASFSNSPTPTPDLSQMGSGTVYDKDTPKALSSVSPKEAPPSGKHRLYLGETVSMMLGRWEKLFKDFFSPKLGIYDLSKVPDIYDSVRYEVLHNSHLNLEGMRELYELSMLFENSVVPQEYGIDRNDKRKIGSMMCHYLLQKIKYDLTVSSSDAQADMRYQLDSSHAEDLAISTLGRCVRTRLYFTSESHLHTLLNVLKYHGEGEPFAIDKQGEAKLDEIHELGYLTQVVIRLFEDREDPTKFRCEIMFSPGAVNDPWNSAIKSDLAPVVLLNRAIPCETLIACLDNAIAAGYGPDEGLNIDEELPPSGEGLATTTRSGPSIHIKHDNSLNILV